MAPVLGEPMLALVMRRAARARRLDRVVVATTGLPADDAIVDLGLEQGWEVHRGSEHDLLDRYVTTMRATGAAVVVRITSDCPLIDPEVIDATIAAFEAGSADYASNTLEPRTFPRGLDVEVVTADALERAWREDRSPAWREHATPYIYRHPERFRLIRHGSPDDHSDQRWSVDTPEDLELVRRLYGELGRDDFGWRDALAVMDAHPDWMELNRAIEQKPLPPA